MDVDQAISQRRSIRRFKNMTVTRDHIEKILTAATLAPSGKNRQPWRFTVLTGIKKDNLVDLLEVAVQHLQSMDVETGSAAWTAKIMRQAPVCIVIHNPYFTAEEDHNGLARYACLVDTQSIGAAIQNMLLTAEGLGLSTLWICDVFFAEQQIGAFLDRKDELIAAVSIGYADETPVPRPRISVTDVTTWLG